MRTSNHKSEIIIGIVAPFGTDKKKFIDLLKEKL